MNPRVQKNVVRNDPFNVEVDGELMSAHPGESIAAVLISNRRISTHAKIDSSRPRGYYCGMGVCWECTVTVNGQANVRACMTTVEPAMKIETSNRSISNETSW